MTEKRFTVPKNYRCIQDNLTKEHYLCEDKTEAINLAYLLNELHEENQQLKETVQLLIKKEFACPCDDNDYDPLNEFFKNEVPISQIEVEIDVEKKD